MTEQNRARTLLYRQLMNVPHRDLAPMVQQLREALASDPDLVSRACVHLATGGTKIRDQVEAAIITLLQAPADFPAYREAGRVLALGSEVYRSRPDGLAGLEPYRLFRIEHYITGSDRKIPRLIKSIMTDYLRWLEGQPSRFDGVVLRNRQAVKRAYIRYHLNPSNRAQAVLFDNDPLADSKLGALKRIAHTDDAHEKARLIIEHKIPYTVATSVLPKIGPEVGVALVGVMTPQEALNSRNWVEQANLLAIPEVRVIYEEKVGQAAASVATTRHRRSAQGSDAGVQAAVEKAAQKSVNKTERINGATLLLVDISSSMDRAIQVAQEFGARLAPLCEDRMIVAFNDYAREIKVEGDTLQDHERAFKGIRAGGATSMQAGLDLALREGFIPDQVVLITDGGENRGRNSTQLYRGLSSSFGSFASRLAEVCPEAHSIVIGVQGGIEYHGPAFAQTIEDAGLRADLFEFNGDYYLFDQVTALLAQSNGPSLIEQILATELPCRY